jgi:hypothetical protein
MSSSTEKAELTPKQMADISALADGSLDPSRRDAVQARIAGSPDLTARYERERRVVELMAAARAERAPASLRARIEAARPTARAQTRRRLVFGGSLAGAIAAVALALALILPAGTPGAPSVSQAAALAQLGPSGPPPGPDPGAPGMKLAEMMGALYFPDWAQSFGWRPVGQRTDTINGRRAVTVYYRRRQSRIAYTIVAAPALSVPPASVRVLHGTALRTLTVNGRLVVTWQRANHTCLLSGAGVATTGLQKLAAWSADGS